MNALPILIVGVLVVHPNLNMPAFTPFVHGGGPVIPGKIFPFVFITIACGAISGFHALISSGTTPKMITRETHCRGIGYGAMLMEGVVGIVALVAASALFPGDYFAINTAQKTPEQIVRYETLVADNSAAGFDLQPKEIARLEQESGEKNLRGRTGGAVTLAIGIAKIFEAIPGFSGLMKYWYHFAIMFEALFILTTIDTGTRVGRFLLGEFLGRTVHKEFARPDWLPGSLATTTLIVAGWTALIWGGSISTIWPMFGIANQLLASVALCVATTILVNTGKARYAWTTLVPLAFVATTTLTAGWMSITGNFLAMTHKPETATQGWINVILTASLMTAAIVILLDSLRVWLRARPTRTEIAPSVSA